MKYIETVHDTNSLDNGSKGDSAVTVLGNVPADKLGFTLPHEHLLSDISTSLSPWTVDSFKDNSCLGVGAHIDSRDTGSLLSGFTATERRMLAEPIRLENLDWIRRWGLNWDNLRLLDDAEAAEEIARYKAVGGTTIVDCTPRGVGRDPSGLCRISRKAGVNVVMGCGWYTHEFHPRHLAQAAEAELTAVIQRDLVEGDPSTGVRAGVIGEIGLSWPPHPDELKVLRAAAHAQAATGAPLQIHPGRNELAPMDAMRTVEAAGGLPSRTIMAHIDRTLFRTEDMLELAKTGCYLEFDLFGQESSFYPLASIDMPNDATRVDHMAALISDGLLDQLLISSDICQKVALTIYGGPGYAHIIDNVLPLMLRKGFTESEIHRITTANTSRVLSWDAAVNTQPSLHTC